jgi:enoyl-CoA hydratase/carnithine racemase
MRGARKLFDEIVDFPLPVVAAVNGLAIGLGCTIAVLSDLVLMADNAHLAESHVAIALPNAQAAPHAEVGMTWLGGLSRQRPGARDAAPVDHELAAGEI